MSYVYCFYSGPFFLFRCIKKTIKYCGSLIFPSLCPGCGTFVKPIGFCPKCWCHLSWLWGQDQSNQCLLCSHPLMEHNLCSLSFDEKEKIRVLGRNLCGDFFNKPSLSLGRNTDISLSQGIIPSPHDFFPTSSSLPLSSSPLSPLSSSLLLSSSLSSPPSLLTSSSPSPKEEDSLQNVLSHKMPPSSPNNILSNPLFHNSHSTIQDHFCFSCACETPYFHRHCSLWTYDTLSRKVIFALKHGGQGALAPLLGRLLIPIALQYPVDYIIPMPLHKKRLLHRGFNQMSLVGYYLSHYTGIPLLEDVLTRQYNTPSQGGLSPSERLSNVYHAFVSKDFIPENHLIPQCSVLLLDDVFTTGASLNVCSRVLLNHNVQRVFCATIAKVL